MDSGGGAKSGYFPPERWLFISGMLATLKRNRWLFSPGLCTLHVTKVLVEKFDIKPTGSVQDDIAAMMKGE